MARAYEPGASVTHLIGAALAGAALTLMVIVAARNGAAAVVGAAVFGSALVLLYLSSTLYHFMTRETRAKELFRRLDHSMIYVLIAGTYTPITLVLLSGGWGWSVFGVVWGCAVLGILVKSIGLRFADWLSTLFYIAMGWMVLVALWPLSQVLPRSGWFWLVGGGVLYTSGTVFYGMSHRTFHRRWFGWHELWHLFVLAGSAFHVVFVLRFVL